MNTGPNKCVTETSHSFCSVEIENFESIPVVTQNVGVSSLQRENRLLLLAEATLIVAHELGTHATPSHYRVLRKWGTEIIFSKVSGGGRRDH